MRVTASRPESRRSEMPRAALGAQEAPKQACSNHSIKVRVRAELGAFIIFAQQRHFPFLRSSNSRPRLSNPNGLPASCCRSLGADQGRALIRAHRAAPSEIPRCRVFLSALPTHGTLQQQPASYTWRRTSRVCCRRVFVIGDVYCVATFLGRLLSGTWSSTSIRLAA